MALLWQHETRGQSCSPPVVMNGRVYLSLFEHKHEVLSFESGQQRHWQEAFLSALDASDGSLPLGATAWEQPRRRSSNDPSRYIRCNLHWCRRWLPLSAFQAGDGVPRWHYKTGGTLLSSPTGANGVVYVGANDGSVYALRASDGALLWQTFVSVAVTAVSSISISLKKS